MITGKLSDSEKKKIEEMRNTGIGYRSIAKELNCKVDRIKDYCRRKGLNGYSGTNLKEEAYDRFIKGFNSKHGDRFEYVSGFVNSEKPVKIKCKKCGHEFSRSAQIARKNKQISCEPCKTIDKKDEELRCIRNNILRRAITFNRAITEINIVDCVECKKPFAKKKDNYCSSKCKTKKNNRLKELRRNKRMKNNGKVDYSITLPRVIEKENNVCYLCGGECDSNDFTYDSKGNYIVGPNHPSIEHVIPVSKGGTHTWDNIKLAHHYCNSVKSDSNTKYNTGQLSMLV